MFGVLQEGKVSFGLDGGISEVIRACEKAEFACAELYHFFAALFKEDREIFHLWLGCALEQENRAKLLALMGKLRHDNIIVAVELELAQAEQTLEQVSSLVRQVKENPPSLREALEIGVDLEQRLDRLIRDNVVKFGEESYERSFLAITGSKQLDPLRAALRVAAC